MFSLFLIFEHLKAKIQQIQCDKPKLNMCVLSLYGLKKCEKTNTQRHENFKQGESAKIHHDVNEPSYECG